MAKLINILAVSLGSGLVLGAGIRALESHPRTSEPTSDDPSDRVIPAPQKRLIARLDLLEARLANLEPRHAAPELVSPLALVSARLDSCEAESGEILSRLSAMEKNVNRAHENNEKLGLEIRDWAASDIRRQILEIEERLARNLDAERRETLQTVVEGVQLRVAERISKLEKEVVGQAAAMVELRECSVKTEQSIQKLLVGIDRLVTSRVETVPDGDSGATVPLQAAVTTQSDAPAQPGNHKQSDEPAPGRRRWSLFG